MMTRYTVMSAAGVRSRHRSRRRAELVARRESLHRSGQAHWVVKEGGAS